jgi:hypothetical protein
MSDTVDNTVFFSRFAFVFLIYVIVTSGYINELLSCQMRHFLTTNNTIRHLFGIIMVFVFIMLEGGWSFDKKLDEEADTDWSKGNVIHSLMIAVLVYSVFLISSKSTLIPNLLFFGLVFTLYMFNTQRAYWLERKRISEETSKLIVKVEIALFTLSIMVLLYGFISYVFYQQDSYGNKFTWKLFLLGTNKCSSFEK